MRFRIRALLAVLCVLSPLAGSVTPARASVAGEIAFAGTITLPNTPCNGCSATFDSTVADGAIASSSLGLGLVTGIHANIYYSEVCTVGENLDGWASGGAVLAGTNVVGVPLPLSAGFEWTRVGLVLVIEPSGGGVGLAGAALFVPTGVITPPCNWHFWSLTAAVAGAVTVVGV